MRKFGPQYRGLERIETGIHPHHVVIVPFVHSVIDNTPNGMRKIIVIGDSGPYIPVTSQVFRRKKRRGPYIAQSARFLKPSVRKLIIGPDSLSIVFDNIDIVLLANLQNFFHR